MRISILVLTMILAFSLTIGCAPNKTYLTGLQATNTSIVFVAKQAKTMCTAKQLSVADCTKIEDIYGKIKKADDAVIAATQAAIKIGQAPDKTTSYVIAQTELLKLASELLNLAADLKIIGGTK